MERYNIENPREIDWEKGILNLKNEGVKLYGVQCGDNLKKCLYSN